MSSLRAKNRNREHTLVVVRSDIIEGEAKTLFACKEIHMRTKPCKYVGWFNEEDTEWIMQNRVRPGDN